MRFLHTADWHIGKSLRARSRMDEHAAALEQLLDVAVQAEVDALLVAGDVFDSPAPQPEAEALVYDVLARLAARRIRCVVIAGNHDHPRKLGALERLLDPLGIHLRAEVKPPAAGGVVRLASRDGREEAQIAVLPFVPERKIVDACLVMGPERGWYEAYAGRVGQMLAALSEPFTAGTVNIVLAHLLVDGGRTGTGERKLHLARSYGIDPNQLPAAAQYVALGHLHRPQEVAAPTRTCYPGSLIELDFGESEQEKRVVVLEARPGGPTSLESVPITAGRRLRDVVARLDELQALAGEKSDAFFRVTLKVDRPTPGLAARVRELLPNALEVSLERPRSLERAANSAPRASLDPVQLFSEYYRRREEADPPPDVVQLFRQLYEEAAG